MSHDKGKTRLDVAQYLGTLLAIILLESHLMPRVYVLILAPFIVWLCLFVASPVGRARWRRTLPVAAVASILGYLIARFVLTSSG